MSNTNPAGPRKFLFLLGSARPDGNSEALARRAAAALPAAAEQQWLRLSELPLPAFEDVRHTGSGRYEPPTGNARLLLDATLGATDLVVVSPLYWYSVSAPVKLYLDHWSGWMRVPGVDFKQRMAGRTMWAVSTFSSTDPTLADPLVGTLRNTADYLGMPWGGTLFGNSTAPGQALADPETVRAADGFFTGARTRGAA
ncbi:MULTISPECIES: NAD(P)H-dependent oxidoreductase [Kitasatospora]|uniref:NADPH-dependent FMN reductase-like domain-containing protein n=1 Tax=Kitasatospora setae (strain ATCC 33774 / DSM 43861 / JCM 3304 / KCC A-0304 / NBRC 14216 / KM-6054) TaxID=452652 RepID=E4ND12_KITSK|nr:MULTISPECIES: NAD(P)H-dependent oxidoreductase [Kitasatospora]BAJ29093.1 hypothetical protein KSE_32840 [Kitasatospora setae KM-6054]